MGFCFFFFCWNSDHPICNQFDQPLSPGQTESQVDPSWKLGSTWVYLRLRLASCWVHLHWLEMTCAHFGRDQIWTQADAHFSPFGHPTQVNASWVRPINILLANEIEDSLPKNVFFCSDLRALARKLACPFGHSTQFSTQVQLASTCDYLPVRLTRALGHHRHNSI